MTDLAFRPARRMGPALARSRPAWRFALFTAFAVASAAGLLVGHAAPGDGSGFEPNLILLLRFMAAMKFAGVVGAVALVAWRLSRPAHRGVALCYVGAVTTMALAPGLIWSLAHVGLAAGLFHVGLLGFLMLAWRDEGALGPIGRRVI